MFLRTGNSKSPEWRTRPVDHLDVRVQQDEGIDGEEARFTVAHQDLRKLVVKVLSCPLIGRMYRSINVTTRFVELESRIARRTFATVF